jgi:LacI family transcriptional regulator
MNGKITLQTIADAAGVSRMTVSRALRDEPCIPVQTRERIKQVAETLGYRPNPLVSALMASLRAGAPPAQSATLAYLSTYPLESDFGRYQYIREMREGAEARARALGFHLEEFNRPALGIDARRAGEILRARGIRGVVLSPLYRSTRLEMDLSPFAVAAIGSSMPRPEVHRAQSHFPRNLALALRQLRRRGFRRIGLAVDRFGEIRTEHLLTALMLRYQDTRKDPTEIVPSLVFPRLERDAVLAWADRWQPEVILGFNYQIPWWLRQEGRRSVRFANLNHGDGDGADFGVDQEPRRIAAAAVDLVVEQLYANTTGLPSHPKTVLCAGKWVDCAAEGAGKPREGAARKMARPPGGTGIG